MIYSLYKYEDFNSAEKIARELQSKVQNNPYLYALLMYIYAGKGEFDKALEMSDKAVSLFKHRGIGANIVMGEIYPQVVSVDSNSPAEKAGLKVSDRIINIGDKDLRLYREGDIMQMLVEYVNKNDPVKLKIHRGNSTELEDLELKPEEYLKPEASQSLAFKAFILRAMGKHDEFESQALKSYELNPEDKLTLITMALTKSDRGSHDEATEIMEQVVKDSDDSLFLLIRILVYANAGQKKEAKEFYKRFPDGLLKTKNALYKRFLDETKGVLQ